MTNKFFFNQYSVDFKKNGTEIVSALVRGSRFQKETIILYKGEIFILKRTRMFSFNYIIYKDSQEIARINDSTKFLTLTSEKTFSIDCKKDIDMVLTFAVFIGVCYMN